MKTTQDFLKSAHDVLSGNAKPFHQQAQEEYIEMWLNDDIHLEDIDEQKLVDLYTQFENNEISEADRCRENCKPVQKQSLAIANDGQNFPIVASSGSKEKPFGDDESDRKADERTSDGIDLIRANLGVDGDRGFGTERESDEKSKCERANSDQVAVRTCKSYRTSIGSVAARDGVDATSGD